MERYSRGGLDLIGYKVGPVGEGVGQPTTLLGPPGKGLRPMGSTWLEVEHGDIGLIFC
jgi:hypothetical protein